MTKKRSQITKERAREVMDKILEYSFPEGRTPILEDMDVGPWSIHYDVKGEACGVYSSDLEHDVVLTVKGDFDSKDLKEIYCKLLVDRLNGGVEDD